MISPELDNSTTPAILIVEDNVPAREALEAVLEALGYQVVVASDGHAAQALFAAQPSAYDLVLSDLVMPGMTGLELFRALKAIAPTVKMLILSGYAPHQGAQELFEEGIAGWLQKPFTMQSLAAAVQEALGAQPH
ncbi:MAG: response regulator [Caldilineaceae bacterium]|nr:response regulator [Caldilineaceae bacterium]